MNDFTIRIENMPSFDYHLGDENILKMKIWCHINYVVQKQLKYENKNSDL
jgi:hypothetical protein